MKRKNHSHLLLRLPALGFRVIRRTILARLLAWPWVVYSGSRQQCYLETHNY